MGATFTGELTWVGHGTFLLVSPGGTRVLLDAFVESCPTTPEELKGDGLGELDLILLSHGHTDHVADATAHADRTGAKVAGMVELMDWFVMHGGLGQESVIDFNKGGTIEVGGLRITMVDAKHSSSTPDHSYAGEPAGFIIELEDGYRLYFAGDTSVFGDMALIAELYEPSLAILPIGDHYTMGPKEAAKAVELLGVTDVIGMHWGTFPPLVGRPQELRERVGEGVRVHALEPGDVFAGVGSSR